MGTIINLKIIYFYFYKEGFWFRLWNDWGMVFKHKNAIQFFSERNGYEKWYYLLWFKFKILRKIKGADPQIGPLADVYWVKKSIFKSKYGTPDFNQSKFKTF